MASRQKRGLPDKQPARRVPQSTKELVSFEEMKVAARKEMAMHHPHREKGYCILKTQSTLVDLGVPFRLASEVAKTVYDEVKAGMSSWTPQATPLESTAEADA